MSDSAAPSKSLPSPLARWRVPLIAATMVATLFATIFLAALGSPEPHEVPVAVVGPSEEVGRIADQLDDVNEDAFDVRAVEDADAGRELLDEREVFGVLDATASTPTIYVAGFNGAALGGVVQGALVPVALAVSGGGAQPEIVDVQKGDGKPTAVFYIVFGMVIAGMAFTIASGALTPIAAVGGWQQRLAATVVTAVVVGIAVSLVALGFDALPGNYVAVAAVAALLMAALALCIQGLALLLGPPGLVVSAIFFIMVGNAASGAAVHPLLLGGGWRQLSPLLPTGAGSTAVVDVAAFSDANLTQPLLVLAGWVVVGSVLMVLGVRRRAAAMAAPVGSRAEA